MNDRVQHPQHYTQGNVECIEAIKAALGEGFEPYCIGNVFKYIWRYRDKNGAEDLRKARQYLEWALIAREGKELDELAENLERCEGCEALQDCGACEIYGIKSWNVKKCMNRRDS